ncbi:hypothetical protein DFJ74DRAFT_714693 [Hyaloraphidium curvatum]|nr:hypothetical protein DFJ74DRAFT_714693 [Hyaloraphidium curvatum]
MHRAFPPSRALPAASNLPALAAHCPPDLAAALLARLSEPPRCRAPACPSTNPAMRCGRCGVRYCGKECQARDWPSHRRRCGKGRGQAEEAAGRALALLCGLLPHYLFLARAALKGIPVFSVGEGELGRLAGFLEGGAGGLFVADKMLFERGMHCPEIASLPIFASARGTTPAELERDHGAALAGSVAALDGPGGFAACLEVPFGEGKEAVLVCRRAEVLDIALEEREFVDALARAAGG